MPLPRELATPPVTKMCFVTGPQDNPVAARAARTVAVTSVSLWLTRS